MATVCMLILKRSFEEITWDFEGFYLGLNGNRKFDLKLMEKIGLENRIN